MACPRNACMHGNQSQSVSTRAISRDRSQSVAISRNQSQSVAISRDRSQSVAISRNQSQSVALSRTQSQSESTRGASVEVPACRASDEASTVMVTLLWSPYYEASTVMVTLLW